MSTPDLNTALAKISGKLSVNSDFGTNDLEKENSFFENEYKKYHEVKIKRFDEARHSHFFRLLMEKMNEGLKEFPGWQGWMLFEYWDEDINGLRLILVYDETLLDSGISDILQNTTNADKLEEFGFKNHNLSLLLRVIREFHVHIRGWHFNEFPHYPENKVALDIMLPENENPYYNKSPDDSFYAAYFQPIRITKGELPGDTSVWSIKTNCTTTSYDNEIKAFFELREKAVQKGKDFCASNDDNQTISDFFKKTSINYDDDFKNHFRFKKICTVKDLKDDIKNKINNNFRQIDIGKKSYLPTDEAEFTGYLQRLCKDFPKSNEFLYLPVFTTFKKGKSPQRKDLQIGSVLIGTDNGIQDNDALTLWNFVQSELLKWYTHYNNYVVHHENLKRKKVATRNAISSVMAGRNMSHNHGSHVLSRVEAWKQNDSNPLRNLYETNRIFNNPDLDDKALENNFLNYLRTRMDFLADATMEVGAPESSKFFLSEIMAELDKNRIMLNLISGLKDFSYTFKFKKNGQDINELSQDFPVAIPNDMVGCHAFYTIVENYIRNIAKHEKTNGRVEFIFDVKDYQKDKNYYEVLLTTNISLTEVVFTNEDDCNCESKWKDKDGKCINESTYKLYKGLFKANSQIGCIKLNQKLAFDLNKKQLSPVIDDKNYELRKDGWGLIEMKASAAYLRKINMGNIDLEQYNAFCPQDTGHEKDFILQVIPHNEHFGYKFLLLKPKEILIIDEAEALTALDEQKRKEFINDGILIASKTTDGKISDSFKYDAKQVYPHKLVIHLVKDGAEDISGAHLSPRILRISKSDNYYNTIIQSVLSDQFEMEVFKACCWKEYIMPFSSRFLHHETNTKWQNILKTNSNKGKAYYDNHGVTWADNNEKNTFFEVETTTTKGYRQRLGVIPLAQSAFLSIMVLDERIQEYANYAKYKQIMVKDIYAKTGICVPDIPDLNQADFNGHLKEIQKLLNCRTCFPDFLIIHLSLVEKMIKVENSHKKIEEFIKDKICNGDWARYNKVIVTSGRGKPQNLPKNIRYLNYSIVAQYLTDMRNKLLLSEACHNARNIS